MQNLQTVWHMLECEDLGKESCEWWINFEKKKAAELKMEMIDGELAEVGRRGKNPCRKVSHTPNSQRVA